MDPPRSPVRSQPSLLAHITIIVILLGFGSAGWWLHLRPDRELDPESIERISKRIGDWQGVDVPLDEGVERMLRADAQVQRSYHNADGELVWLYVGYYGTERGGRPEHTPWVCYPSAGWLILADEVRALPAARGDAGASQGDAGASRVADASARVVEMVVERERERRLVHFWYRTTRSEAIASERSLTIDHVLGRLSPSGRADGALVRLSTPIGNEGIVGARDRLARFADPLVAELEARWPKALEAESDARRNPERNAARAAERPGSVEPHTGWSTHRFRPVRAARARGAREGRVRRRVRASGGPRARPPASPRRR